MITQQAKRHAVRSTMLFAQCIPSTMSFPVLDKNLLRIQRERERYKIMILLVPYFSLKRSRSVSLFIFSHRFS